MRSHALSLVSHRFFIDGMSKTYVVTGTIDAGGHRQRLNVDADEGDDDFDSNDDSNSYNTLAIADFMHETTTHQWWVFRFSLRQQLVNMIGVPGEKNLGRGFFSLPASRLAWAYLLDELGLATRRRKSERREWQNTVNGGAVRAARAGGRIMQRIELSENAHFAALGCVLGKGWNTNQPRTARRKSSKRKAAGTNDMLSVIMEIEEAKGSGQRKRKETHPGLVFEFDPVTHHLRCSGFWVRRKHSEVEAQGGFEL